MARHPLPISPITKALSIAVARHAMTTTGGQTGVGTLFAANRDLERSYARAKSNGRIGWRLADRVCVEVLKVHPATLYPSDFYLTADADAERADARVIERRSPEPEVERR